MTIRLQNGRLIKTDPKFVRHPETADISEIPESKEDYSMISKALTDEQLKILRNPTSMGQDETAFLKMHEKMNHLSMQTMIRLACQGHIPKKFISLENNLLLCAS